MPARAGFLSTITVNSISSRSIFFFSRNSGLLSASSTPMSIQSASGTSDSLPSSSARRFLATTFSVTS